MTLFFTNHDVASYEDAARSDTRRFAAFHKALLKQGVYFPPSQFEAWFVSAAHADRVVDETLKRVSRAIQPIF